MAKDRQPRDVTDEAVIERFFARDEQAIRDIEQKYGVYLRRLSYRILHDREDCEECVNDTCLALWNAIPPARPASLGAFVTAVARRIAVEKYRTRTRQKRVPSELTVSLDELFESETADTAVEDEAASAELAALTRAAGAFVACKTIPCTACQYCMPCPYGLDIPTLLTFLNWYRTSETKPSAAEVVRRYRKAVPDLRSAEHCTGCGKCAPHCPQAIDIPKELAAIDKWIEGLKNELV